MRRVLLANTPDLLSEEWIARYKELGVYGVGLNKKYIVVTGPDGHINLTNNELIDRVRGKATDKFIALLNFLFQQLHGHDLTVFSWTFRNEYQELSSWEDGQDPYVEYQRFLDVGLDGYFTDFPGSLRRFIDAKENAQVIHGIHAPRNGMRSGL